MTGCKEASLKETEPKESSASVQLEQIVEEDVSSLLLRNIKTENGSTIKSSKPEIYLHSALGQVVKVLNENYAVAVVMQPSSFGVQKATQVIFDIYDLWLHDNTTACNENKLSDVVSPGTYIKVHAIQVDSASETILLGTAAIVSNSLVEIKSREMPPDAIKLCTSNDVHGNKINNFKIVKRILSNIRFSLDEEKIIDAVTSGSLFIAEAENTNNEDGKISEEEKVASENYDNSTETATELNESDMTEADLAERDVSMSERLEEAVATSSRVAVKDIVVKEEVSDEMGFTLMSVCSVKEENLMDSTDYEDEQTLTHSPLPLFITNTTGVLISVLDDRALIKFEILLNENLKINSFAIMYQDSLMIEETGFLTKSCKVGYPVTFHAVGVDTHDHNRYYVVTKGYVDGSQSIKKKFMMEVSQENWYEDWTMKQDTVQLAEKVNDHMKPVDSYQRKIPCTLTKSVAKIIKTSEDVNGKYFTTILKVERFDMTCYALYISDKFKDLKDNQTHYINAIQLDENSTINYMVTALWSSHENDVAPMDYGYLSLAQVDIYHQYLSHSEEILFLSILISDSDKEECVRMTEILSKISVENFRALIEAYVKNLETEIDIEDFDTAKKAKCPISLNTIKTDAKSDIDPDELLELLINVNKTYSICGASGCLQFLTFSHLEKISVLGIQAAVESLPKSELERLSWRIPEEWLKQASCMAWEEVAMPPAEGVPASWTTEHDNELLIGAAVHGLLDHKQMKSEDLWNNLSDDPR